MADKPDNTTAAAAPRAANHEDGGSAAAPRAADSMNDGAAAADAAQEAAREAAAENLVASTVVDLTGLAAVGGDATAAGGGEFMAAADGAAPRAANHEDGGSAAAPRAANHEDGGSAAWLTLSLADLLPDAEGNVVLFDETGVGELALVSPSALLGSGIAPAEAVAGGLDVAGMAYYSFASGLTLFLPTDVHLSVLPA